LGFFDRAIAAPSMKAALEAWGADRNLFHRGAAKESDDPDVVAATMANPGVVLERPGALDTTHIHCSSLSQNRFLLMYIFLRPESSCYCPSNNVDEL
jgi:hypothetical protein